MDLRKTEKKNDEPMENQKSSSAFDKRVKRRLIGRNHDFFAVCSPGLEKICEFELKKILPGNSSISPREGGIYFSGKPDAGFIANLCMGSASRILMRLANFKASNFLELEKNISQIDWEIFLPRNPVLSVQVSCKKSRLFHSDAVAQRVNNIVVDCLGKQGLNCLPQKIMIRLENDLCHVSLDMSGELLFRRGIKLNVTKAPLRETLAFSLLNLTKFSSGDILQDPMCGSGTFSVEAALIQEGIPSGYFRNFAFESWPGFRPNHFAYIKKQILSNIPQKKFSNKIFASDINQNAVNTVLANIKGHKFLSSIEVCRKNFFDIRPPGSEKGVILLNPPYGKRLEGFSDQKKFFREIGMKFKKDFSGWRVGIICPSSSTKKALGLKTLKDKKVFHGGLWVYLVFGKI